MSDAIRGFDAVIIGPGSFFTSLMPTLLVEGVRESLKDMAGPIVFVCNLLTEGLGMRGFTAADAVGWVERTIDRQVDLVVFNNAKPSAETIERYASEHKEPLALGELPPHLVLVEGPLWTRDIARHDRPRLSHAVWSVLSRNVLS